MSGVGDVLGREEQEGRSGPSNDGHALERLDATIEAAHAGQDRRWGDCLSRAGITCCSWPTANWARESMRRSAPPIWCRDFLQAQQIFHRFDGHDQQELLAWLTQILRFKLAQATNRFVGTEMRDVSRELSIEQGLGGAFHPVDFSFQQTVERYDDLERLRLALERLPPDYQTAIEMRSLQQKSFNELGWALSRSPEAARQVWRRAVERLEEEMRSFDSTGQGDSGSQGSGEG